MEPSLHPDRVIERIMPLGGAARNNLIQTRLSRFWQLSKNEKNAGIRWTQTPIEQEVHRLGWINGFGMPGFLKQEA